MMKHMPPCKKNSNIKPADTIKMSWKCFKVKQSACKIFKMLKTVTGAWEKTHNLLVQFIIAKNGKK